MPFLNFVSEQRDEWGFYANFVPAIGDNITLSYGLPDNKIEDCVVAVVLTRCFSFPECDAEELEIMFTVKLDNPLPEGCIASSPVWPALSHSERTREFEERRTQPRRANSNEVS